MGESERSVWISTAQGHRRADAGISYHHIDETGRKTACGRYISDGTKVLRGHVLPLAEVLALYKSAACKTCNGAGVPPPNLVSDRIGGRAT